MHRSLAAGIAVLLGLAGAGIFQPLEPAPATGSAALPLRGLADRIPLRIGATLETVQIDDADYAGTLAREFNALTAENAMKWYSIQATRGVFDFSGADAVLEFAEANDMEVRGHALIWAQDAYTPDWVKAITDPDELRTVVREHIRTVLDRYHGRITRWDVVNEPLASGGSGPSDSVFRRVLGPDWLAEVYRYAHEVDPTIELWLNEFGADWVPGKHQALLDLVGGMREDGVPLDGVGLQTHRISVDGPTPATFEGQLRDYADLGLKVAITELDVAVSPEDPKGLERQAIVYRTIVSACLAVPACEEVTMWGVTDRDTWLDSQPFYEPPTRPLLFDEQFQPKAAYDAVAEVLAAGRPTAPPATAPPVTAPPTPGPTGTDPEPATPVPGTPNLTG